MLAVFTCNEYQSDVGNILYIHLLGKIRQISEQSRTELFDLIRNSVVDIITPEEVDDQISIFIGNQASRVTCMYEVCQSIKLHPNHIAS